MVNAGGNAGTVEDRQHLRQIRIVWSRQQRQNSPKENITTQVTNKDILIEKETLYKAHSNRNPVAGYAFAVLDAGREIMLSLEPLGLPTCSVELSSPLDTVDEVRFVNIEESSWDRTKKSSSSSYGDEPEFIWEWS